MSLKLMYITNNPDVAVIAEETGVDRIFVDLEYIGKEERQAGLDSVKSHCTISDVVLVRKKIKNSALMVRINPMHEATSEYGDSYDEINRVIDSGAELIMLPMYRSVSDVEKFLKIVNGRIKTQLLAETIEACDLMEEIAAIPEVDEIYIGLNDLHLACHRKFMFELLGDGTVEKISDVIKRNKKPFGFGGIARIGYGQLPAEYIIREHYRLGSSCVILSRSFCNANKIPDIHDIYTLFNSEIIKIREIEHEAAQLGVAQLEENRKKVQSIVKEISNAM